MNNKEIAWLEEKASSGHEFAKCYSEYLKIGDIKRAITCLKKMKQILPASDEASYYYSFGAKKLFEHGEHEYAFKYLKASEDMSSSFSNLLCCAEDWKELGYHESSIRCVSKIVSGMKNNEKRANSVFDYCNAAKKWSYIKSSKFLLDILKTSEVIEIDYNAAIHRCMNIAEKLSANNIANYFLCAESWNELENEEGTMRCMKIAKSLASDVIDLTKCAEAWRKIGNNDEFNSCMTEAVQLSKNDIFDLSWCVKILERNGDEKSALNAMRLIIDTIIRNPEAYHQIK